MNPDQICKLTKSPVSNSLFKCIERLSEGHPVDPEFLALTPEIRLARQCVANAPVSTDMLDQASRRVMQNGILRTINALGSYKGMKDKVDGSGKEPDYSGFVDRGRQVHFILGLPASGKSSALADVVSMEFSARIIDSDMVKEMIPEFNDGWGASAVHNESTKIAAQSFSDALALGDNIVIPKIGEPPDSIMEMMEQAKAAGYTCHVHMMDLNPNKALGRMLGRFVTTGRYVPIEIAQRYIGEGGENLMRSAFDELVESDLCDGYSLWSNDVAMGDDPVLLDYDGISAQFLDDASIDRTKLLGVAPENAFEADTALLDINVAIKDDTLSRLKAERNQATTDIAITSGVKAEMISFQNKLRSEMRDWFDMPETRSNPDLLAGEASDRQQLSYADPDNFGERVREFDYDNASAAQAAIGALRASFAAQSDNSPAVSDSGLDGPAESGGAHDAEDGERCMQP